MKAKSKNFIVPLIIYPFDVMVSIGETDQQLEKKLSKYMSVDTVAWKWSNETQMGRFCLLDTNQGLIKLRHSPETNMDYANLQHEIFHYVMHIMNRIGQSWSLKSDESYAYLVGYLTKEIYSKL